ncbi:hypothetical protein [Sphingobium sp. CCH11-B1]|uniref:hypothetical protein n=1 Tax=Sphingobium sp. CCH11-B1 TaxID=1768781 RepID=UPI0008367777|nr:hypothetical protein [Sphingobium sp. CCH11-B1]
MGMMRFDDKNPYPPQRTDPRLLLSILGAAFIVGGGSLAAGVIAHKPDAVKPATGSAQALALASDRSLGNDAALGNDTPR